jgi:hypothetical protein
MNAISCLHTNIEIVTVTHERPTLEGKPITETETYGLCMAPDCRQRIPLDQVKIPGLQLFQDSPDLPGEIISHE